MIEDNTYEENVKDFNRMFFELDDKDFNWDTHAMIDHVVQMIEVEYAMNYLLDDFNIIYNNRIHDVLKWESYQKSMCPGGSIPPIDYDKTTSKRRKPLTIPKGLSFFIDRSGRRRRKKYL